jgi:hypothetical protein
MIHLLLLVLGAALELSFVQRSRDLGVFPVIPVNVLGRMITSDRSAAS